MKVSGIGQDAGIEGMSLEQQDVSSDSAENAADESAEWYAMRSLSRVNATRPLHELLTSLGFTVFTPLTTRVFGSGTRKVRREVPTVSDLLFVLAQRSRLDSVVRRNALLQYRYVKGGYCRPMTVPVVDMERFIRAVSSMGTTAFLQPQELTPAMYGRRVRIVGGELDGFEGHLLKCRGSKRRRLIVELPGLIAATVEVSPEYVQLVDNLENHN